jgi:hypothetical protein
MKEMGKFAPTPLGALNVMLLSVRVSREGTAKEPMLRLQFALVGTPKLAPRSVTISPPAVAPVAGVRLEMEGAVYEKSELEWMGLDCPPTPIWTGRRRPSPGGTVHANWLCVCPMLVRVQLVVPSALRIVMVANVPKFAPYSVINVPGGPEEGCTRLMLGAKYEKRGRLVARDCPPTTTVMARPPPMPTGNTHTIWL